MTPKSARTSSSETPGRIRPCNASQPVVSSRSKSASGSSAFCIVTGAQNSLGQGSSPRNPGAATPITVNLARFRETPFPTICGSAPNSLLHRASLSTTTGLAPGARQSSSTNVAPDLPMENLVHTHDLVRPWNGQQLQGNPVQHGKNSGVHPDSQRDRQDCDHREPWILRQRSRAIAKVLRNLLEPEPAPGTA